MLSPSEMDDMHPFWNPDETVMGGILDPYEGDIDPSQLTQALAKGARDLGAQVERFAPVSNITRLPSAEAAPWLSVAEITLAGVPVTAIRIEKGYHGWGADIGPEYTLFDAGLDRFANMNKGDFIGRDAVAAQASVAPDWTWVGIEITQESKAMMQVFGGAL